MRESVALINITPEIADALLSANEKNRPQRPTGVRTLRNMLTEGLGALTNDAICLTGPSLRKPGRLVNGQHRCAAIVASGVSLRAIVLFNVSESMFSIIDRGSRRSVGDNFALSGQPIPRSVQGAVSVLWAHRLGRLMQSNGGAGSRPEPAQALQLCEKHKDVIPFLLGHLKQARALSRTPAAVLASMYMHARTDAEHANSFWAGVFSGVGLEADDPALLLRNKLLGERSTGSRAGGEAPGTVVALCLKAVQAHRSGSKLRHLRVARDETIPHLAGWPRVAS